MIFVQLDSHIDPCNGRMDMIAQKANTKEISYLEGSVQEPMTLLTHTSLTTTDAYMQLVLLTSQPYGSPSHPVVHASSAVPQLSRTSHPSDHEIMQITAWEMRVSWLCSRCDWRGLLRSVPIGCGD